MVATLPLLQPPDPLLDGLFLLLARPPTLVEVGPLMELADPLAGGPYFLAAHPPAPVLWRLLRVVFPSLGKLSFHWMTRLPIKLHLSRRQAAFPLLSYVLRPGQLGLVLTQAELLRLGAHRLSTRGLHVTGAVSHRMGWRST